MQRAGEARLQRARIYQVRAPSGAGPPARRSANLGSGARGLDALRFRAADGTYFLGEEELALARSSYPGLEVVAAIEERDIPVRFFPSSEAGVAEAPPEDARHAVLAFLLAEGRAQGDVGVRFLGRNRAVPADGFVLDRAGGERRYVWQLVSARHVQPAPEGSSGYPALRELFHDPDARVVLALGSGGLKLFAHATALGLLEEAGCGERIEEIWGSSGGAIVAVLYSHGLSPQAIEQTGYDLYAGRYELPLRPSKLQLVRHLLRDALLPSPHPEATGFVDLAQGLSRMLEHYCAQIQPRRPFYCVAFNLADCRTEVLTAGAVAPHLADFAFETDAREAALASSAVPLLFLPRRIQRGERSIPYVDGSTTEDVPLWSIVRKWDLDRAAGTERRKRLVVFYVKLTGNADVYRTHAGRISKVRLLQTIAAAGIDTMHRRDVALLEHRPDVQLVALDLNEASPDLFDTRHIPAYIRSAKEIFPRQLARIEERLRQR
jgi:hypothetical protein